MNFQTNFSRLNSLKAALAVAALARVFDVSAQDHGHLYISAQSQQGGAQLYFDNGGIFDLASGYVKTLLFNTNAASRYVSRYDGNITITPRSTNTLRGADYGPNAAAPGSVIYCQITRVDGPLGGAFEFWENTGSEPALSIPVGNGPTNLVKFSQSTGAPGDDPWGHIHGRRFTATAPGIYRVTFRAFELSTNGPAGGPIHAPSEPITIAFQADFAITSIARTNNLATVKFGTAVTHDFTVQASTNLLSSNSWVNISAKLRGNDYFQTVQDPNATGAAKFYRVLVEPFVP
uniref:Host specificity protein n=1 Tax=uncultured bacterium Lac161 TaxID=1403002 RepID=A0A059Q9R3_9BACT|nr:host specificity protein [uncultured bacterium Lac161]